MYIRMYMHIQNIAYSINAIISLFSCHTESREKEVAIMFKNKYKTIQIICLFDILIL